MNYAEKLDDPRWTERSRQILKRDGWKCVLCKAEGVELHAHHLEYSGEPWEATDSQLMTLCVRCHGFEHGKGDQEKLIKQLKVLRYAWDYFKKWDVYHE